MLNSNFETLCYVSSNAAALPHITSLLFSSRNTRTPHSPHCNKPSPSLSTHIGNSRTSLYLPINILLSNYVFVVPLPGMKPNLSLLTFTSHFRFYLSHIVTERLYASVIAAILHIALACYYRN